MVRTNIALFWVAVAIPAAATLMSILDIAQQTKGFTTLTTAISIAGGVGVELDCYHQCRKFTVFAPTDEAFAALPPALVTKLTTNKDYVEHLRQLLRYHILPTRRLISTITSGASIATLQGESIKVKKLSSGKITVNGNAEVVLANVKASNGVVHAIDAVLVPSFLTNDLVAVAASSPKFDTLVTAVSAVSGLVKVLQGGPFAIFAPTNAAFAKLGTSTINSLLADPNGKLAAILKYHVVAGIVTADELKDGNVKTVNGASISVDVRTYKAILNGNSKIVKSNILASNGVIHVIDTVLLPPS